MFVKEVCLFELLAKDGTYMLYLIILVKEWYVEIRREKFIVWNRRDLPVNDCTANCY